jgi:uncharacterized membrane protein
MHSISKQKNKVWQKALKILRESVIVMNIAAFYANDIRVRIAVMILLTSYASESRLAMTVISIILTADVLQFAVWVSQFQDIRSVFIAAAARASGVSSVVEIHCAEDFHAVMQASMDKGYGVERYVARAAWRPALSVESEDGDKWRILHQGTLAVLKARGGPNKLRDIAERILSEDADSTCTLLGTKYDANWVTRFTLACFLEYLFNVAWSEKYEILVQASWEWRREISAKGWADPVVKANAVALLLDLLRADLVWWEVHREAWADPLHYSVVLQPFLISPAINVSDVAVTLHAHPDWTIDRALRMAHPFPVLERFISEPLLLPSGQYLPARTQTVLYLDRNPIHLFTWSPFGVGFRRCIGSALALAVLEPLSKELHSCKGHEICTPAHNHRYSGRHNDATSAPWNQRCAFAWIVISALVRAWWSS